MNNCIICGKEIKGECQFIDGRWFHNDCVLNLIEKNKELELKLKRCLDALYDNGILINLCD